MATANRHAALQCPRRGAALAEHPAAPGQVFNVGATEEITIRGLAERVLALTGSRSEIQMVPYDAAYGPGFEDMQRRVPDISKIQRTIGWVPTVSLDETLRQVIQNHRARE